METLYNFKKERGERKSERIDDKVWKNIICTQVLQGKIKAIREVD